MPVTLTIKNVPEAMVKRLSERARRHGRSLTPREVLAEVQRLGLSTPGEAAAMIREDRAAKSSQD